MSEGSREIHLFIPGPAGISPGVREAAAGPVEPHYGADFVAAYNHCIELLQRVFQTEHELFLIVGPGTAALDAALGSTLPEESRVLVPANGWFAERLGEMVAASGARVDFMEFPVGGALDVDAIVSRIGSGGRYDAVAWVHHETSTGVLNPVEPIAAAAREQGALSLVDAIASLGGADLPVDRWGVDLCVSVSNKCLAAPPGIAPLSVSPAAWQAVESCRAHRGWYQDLRNWRWYRENWADWHPYPTTVPTGVIRSLVVAAEEILEEGLDRHLERTADAARATRAGLRNLGFEMFCDDDIASPVTTSVRAHPELPTTELLAYLRDAHGIFVSGGIGELRGKIFRVGHMGTSVLRDSVEMLLNAIEEALRLKGVDVEEGVALDGIWSSVA